MLPTGLSIFLKKRPVGEGTRRYTLSSIEPSAKPRESVCTEVSLAAQGFSQTPNGADRRAPNDVMARARRVLRLVVIMLPRTFARLLGLVALVALRTVIYHAIVMAYTAP